jgi:tripartite-type tricarboxylate transporter receptor subunit TctC
MKFKGFKLVVLFSILAAFGTGSSVQAADVFPNHTVTIVVPFSPGGGHDFVARLLASKLGPVLHQSVIVLNKPGADAMIGAQYVAQASPDGYTILIGSPAETVIAPYIYKHMQYDPTKDLSPVTLAGETPIALVAPMSTPVSTVPELISYVKKYPGKLSYGTPGIGSSHDLAVKWIEQLAGINIQDIPYKGSSDATVAALSAQVPLASVGLAPVVPLWKTGKLKILAVMNHARPSWLKEIPTASETPGLEAVDLEQWMGIFVPAKTPTKTIDTLNEALATVLKDPAVKASMIDQGVDPVGNSVADFNKFLDQERSKYEMIVKASKIPSK